MRHLPLCGEQSGTTPEARGGGNALPGRSVVWSGRAPCPEICITRSRRWLPSAPSGVIMECDLITFDKFVTICAFSAWVR